jgi:5-methylthioadenosine/S-adenosylhomocysteine deaminase
MKRKLIKCGWLISEDDAIGTQTDVDVLVEDDRIAAVGRNLEAADAEVVDASGMIVMPGLINAHMHTWEYGLRGAGGQWISADYHRNMHGNMATRYQAEDVYIGNLVGALDQINSGVTTLFDWCHILRDLEMANRAIDALEESGIRAVFGHGSAKPPPKEGTKPYSETNHPRERVEALRKGRLASDDRLVTMAIAMLGPDQCVESVLLHDYRLAREFGLLSTSHIFGPPQRRVIPNGIRILADHGLLGPDHNICHGNFMSDEELDIVLDAGASVTPTVLVETRGKAPRTLTTRALARGVIPSLGIDTPPMVSCDMFDEMRAALWEARRHEFLDNDAAGGAELTEAPIVPKQALEWTLKGGAIALQMQDRIGSITPGKKADIIALRASDLNLGPVHDPVATAVLYAHGHNVDFVLIDGEFRKRDGKLLYDSALLAKKQAELAASGTRIRREGGFVQ